jgi:HlyD family secretion protein
MDQEGSCKMDLDKQNATKKTWLRRAGIGLLTLVMAMAAVYQVRALSQPQAVNGTGVEASGVIRADSVSIASEFGGRIAEMPVAEGQRVSAGDLLVQLDTQLLDARIEALDATIELAKAALMQAKAGARPGQIAVAQAQLSQAQAGYLAAQQAVSDTQALVENPQDINLQIAVTTAQLESSQHQLAQAVALKDAAEIADERYWKEMGKLAQAQDKLANIPEPYRPPLPDVPLEAHLVPNTYWQAWVGVNAASAQKEGTAAALAQLYTRRADPQALRTQANEAKSALAQAAAQVAAAQAQLAGLKAGATDEQMAALEARVAQAQAGREALTTQRAMMRLTSPISGTVMEVVAHPAEVAAPGATLLTLADTDNIILTVYVPETLVGQVRLDQPVQVTVDSFPGRTFEGRVSYISDKTEFTPRNVATQIERVNLVFAVEIHIANDDGALKPGMPADARFGN